MQNWLNYFILRFLFELKGSKIAGNSARNLHANIHGKIFVRSENILNYLKFGVILSHAKMVYRDELAQSVIIFNYVALFSYVTKLMKSAVLLECILALEGRLFEGGVY